MKLDMFQIFDDMLKEELKEKEKELQKQQLLSKKNEPKKVLDPEPEPEPLPDPEPEPLITDPEPSE